MQILVFLFFFPLWIPGFTPPETHSNPLSKYDPVWKDPKYAACNTARSVKYLTPLEKEVIYILNLVRRYPNQFNASIVAKWPNNTMRKELFNNEFYKSLVTDLKAMKAVGLLKADSIAWVSAQCHAFSSGQTGYVGHTRQTEACIKKERFYGECCQYGWDKAIFIVMGLLIDENVPSLGHRKICLDPGYKSVGVSNQPHATYGTNTVLDFMY